MKEDIQKPILYKADPYVFAQIEKMKETSNYKFNRNEFINRAVFQYIEFVKLMQSPEYTNLNEVSFKDTHLQKILYMRLRNIAYHYPPK